MRRSRDRSIRYSAGGHTQPQTSLRCPLESVEEQGAWRILEDQIMSIEAVNLQFHVDFYTELCVNVVFSQQHAQSSKLNEQRALNQVLTGRFLPWVLPFCLPHLTDKGCRKRNTCRHYSGLRRYCQKKTKQKKKCSLYLYLQFIFS